MNILFDIAHPADVHLFRNAREKLIARGHTVIFMARDKDVVIQLLDAYSIPYIKSTKAQKGIIALLFELMQWFCNAFSIILRNKVDLAVSLSSPSTAWAAKLQGVPHIMFNDTETGVAQLRMARPATKIIHTPECLLSDWGPKQIRYKGIHDLAYLAPKYVQPVSPLPLVDMLTEGGDWRRDDYALLRFVSWGASHDRGVKKTSADFQKRICEFLREKMKVYISAEGNLPEELEPLRLDIPPDKLHSVMRFAKLVVGDGATTATEAAVMGVPSLYISPFADSLGYCSFLEKYGLLDAVKDEEAGFKRVRELIENPELDARMQRRMRLFEDTIDLTEYIVESCEAFSSRG
jgi:predicted glycosyltransferase